MPTADRKNLGVAKGVSIHIGGIYSNPKTKSGYAITGSKGYFTINGGDNANTAAEADVENRQDANKKAGAGSDISVTVQQRAKVNKTFKLNADGTMQ